MTNSYGVCQDTPQLKGKRDTMVRQQIEQRGIREQLVLQAMRSVPRHCFVPEELRAQAYADIPLPIACKQTISQPYIVAMMTQHLGVEQGHRILEIGTGSGYQTAILAYMGAQVYTVEIKQELYESSQRLFRQLSFENVYARCQDGYDAWSDYAPFDRIIITAAPPSIPQLLLEQLTVDGVMVVPVGTASQELLRIERSEAGYHEQRICGVRFVPMVGQVQHHNSD